MDDHDKDLHSILTNICELDVCAKTITTPSPTKNGFPSVKDHMITNESKISTSRKKKSLFAMQFDKTHGFVPKPRECGREKILPLNNTRLELFSVLNFLN